MFFHEIRKLNSQLQIVSSLKEQERLGIHGGKFYKYSSPEGSSAILTAVKRAFQNLHRTFFHQTTAGELQGVDDLVSQLLMMAQAKEVSSSQWTGYQRYQELCRSKAFIDKLSAKALPEYHFILKKSANLAPLVKIDLLIDKCKEASKILAQEIVEQEGALQDDSPILEETINRLQTPGASINDVHTLVFRAHQVKALLKDRFGVAAAERAFSFYRLQEQHVLDGDDLHALLLGIRSNLTLEDIKYIHAHSGKHAEPFDQLSKKQIVMLMKELNHPNVPQPKKNPSKTYAKQLEKDLAWQECVFKVMDDYKPGAGATKFAYAEFLARSVVYSLYWFGNKAKFADGVLVPMYDRKGEIDLKQAHRLYSKNGLSGAAFLPALPHQETSKNTHVQVAFRGTWDLKSFKRNFSLFEREQKFGVEGSGRTSFKNAEKQLLKNLEHTLNLLDCDKKVVVEFLGHSLGGSDAQRMCQSYSHHLKEKKNSKVKGINLFCFNGSNIERDKAKEFINDVKEQSDLTFKVLYFDPVIDPVLNAGSVKLGYWGLKKERPSNLSVSIFRFHEKHIAPIDEVRKQFEGIKTYLKKLEKSHTVPCLAQSDVCEMKLFNVATNHPKDVEMHPNLTYSTDALVSFDMITSIGSAAMRAERFFVSTYKKLCAISLR